MKKPIFVSLVVLGLLVGMQQFVSGKLNQDKSAAIMPEYGLVEHREEVSSGQPLLLAGNVPCNPAKQVCED